MDVQTVKAPKRKKKPKRCPNPLFLKWLEQWRDEAKSKESKLHFVYSKAISSLKKYPLPLESGKEAMLLDGIGSGIAKRLDEELARHRSYQSDNGRCDAEENFISESNSSDMRIPPPTSMSMLTSSSTFTNNNSKDNPEPRAKKKKKTCPMEYIPSYRSGPYAIIITLHKASEKSSYKGYMTKPELQQQAQPFSDFSFAMPEPDSYYTAWSSMSSLIKKGLVEKTGNPARYYLSDSGHVLAEKLLSATEDQTTRSPSYQVPPISRITGTDTSNAKTHISEKMAPDVKHTPESKTDSKNSLSSYRYKTTGTEVKLKQSGSLRYWFVNSNGQCVENKHQASVIIDEEISLGYLIKCKLGELEKSGMKYRLDNSRQSQDGYVFAFLAGNSITNGNITTEKTAARQIRSKGSSETINRTSDDSDEEPLMRPLFQRLTKEPDICITHIDSIQNTKVRESSPTSQKICAPVVSSESSPDRKRPPTQVADPEIISIEGNSGSEPMPSRKVIPEFELNPGSFEIILCVDFAETSGGGRKEAVVKELRMNGVQFDIRKLSVGDFLWIAQEKTAPIPGQLVLPKRRELVLDYVIERKRMDDLCSSIKDGRFKEQKFRLSNSGLRHPVYLVEDFGTSNLSLPIQTLEQAIVNTQIGQEFFVKRTHDIKESVAYLTLMTRYLQNMYNNKTLKAIKKEQLDLVVSDENQLSTFLMTFQELSDISLKNRVLTVGEAFGKQLLQIPGLTAEKVVPILESYPTLRHLLDTYEEQVTEKEKEGLLSELKCGKNQRKIGPALSKTVYNLYCTKGALS